MTKPSIGFIGLGLMGSAMAHRLLECRYAVTTMANRSRTNLEKAVAAGAKEAASAREIAEISDIVMICVDTSASVEGRMRGPDGILAGLRPDAVVIDFGTSLPASTRTLARETEEKGGAYLDAPLGRTPAHAKDGLLNIMTAGDKAAFDKVEPVLQELGENVFYLGESGSGHTIKLLNNFFGMTIANAISEAYAMADAAGIDRRAAHDVIAAGPLRSGMMDFVSAYALDGDPTKLEFSVRNAAKDVGYYDQMVQDAGKTSLMAGGALTALRAAIEDGQGDDMVSQMVDFHSKRMNG